MFCKEFTIKFHNLIVNNFFLHFREKGIRTLDIYEIIYNRLAISRFRPLSHLSGLIFFFIML